MEILERWLHKAEDELTEYSTPARKREKLRRALGLAVSAADQQQMREQLQALLPGRLGRLVEENRQTVALPFWGIAGLGLLEGFLGQPLGWVGATLGTVAAFGLQKWGWQLEARRLLWNTLQEISQRSSTP
ncbi:MAG: hypothetical protein OHK0012_27890 [Synechococcales cyanobacterium]